MKISEMTTRQKKLWLVAMFGSMPLIVLMHMITMVALWSWYIVPTFHVERINMSVAFGMSLFIQLFTAQSSLTKNKERQNFDMWEVTGNIIGEACGPLVIGWIGSFFV